MRRRKQPASSPRGRIGVAKTMVALRVLRSPWVLQRSKEGDQVGFLVGGQMDIKASVVEVDDF